MVLAIVKKELREMGAMAALALGHLGHLREPSDGERERPALPS